MFRHATQRLAKFPHSNEIRDCREAAKVLRTSAEHELRKSFSAPFTAVNPSQCGGLMV